MPNEELLRKVGFGNVRDMVAKNICPGCDQKIDRNKFRDENSLKESYLSGYCQSCQDVIFKDTEDLTDDEKAKRKMVDENFLKNMLGENKSV